MQKDKSGHCAGEASGSFHYKENVPSGPSQHQAGVPLEESPPPVRRPGADYVDHTQAVFFCQSLVPFSH